MNAQARGRRPWARRERAGRGLGVAGGAAEADVRARHACASPDRAAVAVVGLGPRSGATTVARALGAELARARCRRRLCGHRRAPAASCRSGTPAAGRLARALARRRAPLARAGACASSTRPTGWRSPTPRSSMAPLVFDVADPAEAAAAAALARPRGARRRPAGGAGAGERHGGLARPGRSRAARRGQPPARGRRAGTAGRTSRLPHSRIGSAAGRWRAARPGASSAEAVAALADLLERGRMSRRRASGAERRGRPGASCSSWAWPPRSCWARSSSPASGRRSAARRGTSAARTSPPCRQRGRCRPTTRGCSRRPSSRMAGPTHAICRARTTWRALGRWPAGGAGERGARARRRRVVRGRLRAHARDGARAGRGGRFAPRRRSRRERASPRRGARERRGAAEPGRSEPSRGCRPARAAAATPARSPTGWASPCAPTSRSRSTGWPPPRAATASRCRSRRAFAPTPSRRACSPPTRTRSGWRRRERRCTATAPSSTSGRLPLTAG